jgi:uncharacterized membrane protein YraQ (UPF0718 family)
VLVALAVPLLAVAVGTLLALAGGASPRVLVPVRSFALAAVLVAVVTHLVPEAIAVGGPWTLAVFAAGVAAPSLLGKLGRNGGTKTAGHARVATELGFLGVVLHQIGDGLALGTLGDHRDVVIAIGVHTVPLAAVVALGMEELHGRRVAIARAVVLVAATAAGVIATVASGKVLAAGVAPWVDAAVAGLLVHVLSHDLPTPRRTGTAPLIELAAIVAGVAVVVLTGGEGDPGGIIDALGEVVELIAVPVAAGLAASIVLELVVGRTRERLLARGGVMHGIGAAAIAGTCSCRVVAPARAAAERGKPAAVIAFVLAAPELGLDTVLIGTQVLGIGAAMVRLAAGVAIAAVAGVVAGRFAIGSDDNHEHDHDHDHDHDHHHHHHHHHEQGRRWWTVIDETIIHSGPWLVIGIAGTALALIAIPDGALAGNRWLELALALAIAIPTYVCAPAATPLAAALIARGLAPGAAIAGLVLGAATNRAGLSVIARAYGTGAVAAVVGIAMIGAAAVAVVIEVVKLPALEVPPLPYEGTVALVAAIVLGVAVVRGLWRYGLAAWLEPLHGSDHRHHQHADGAPCEAGCHDH